MALLSYHEHYYSSKKAVDELKLPQTPVKEAVYESFEWLKQNKYLSK